MKKRVIGYLTASLVAVAVVITFSSFVSDDEGGSGTPIPFTESHAQSVSCPDTRYVLTTFYGPEGEVLGVTLIEGGYVRSEYYGPYTYYITETGGTPEHWDTAVACYGFSVLSCTPKNGCY